MSYILCKVSHAKFLGPDSQQHVNMISAHVCVCVSVCYFLNAVRLLLLMLTELSEVFWIDLNLLSLVWSRSHHEQWQQCTFGGPTLIPHLLFMPHSTPFISFTLLQLLTNTASLQKIQTQLFRDKLFEREHEHFTYGTHIAIELWKVTRNTFRYVRFFWVCFTILYM